MFDGIGSLKRYDKHRSHISGIRRAKRFIQRVEISHDFREWQEQRKKQMAKIKEFYCRSCAMWMKIEVEPDYTAGEVRLEYPKALEWLDKVNICPVCGGDLVE